MGDIVQVEPLGYRLGPMKTYLVSSILHKDARDEGSYRGSDTRHLNYVPIGKEESDLAEKKAKREATMSRVIGYGGLTSKDRAGIKNQRRHDVSPYYERMSKDHGYKMRAKTHRQPDN